MQLFVLTPDPVRLSAHVEAQPPIALIRQNVLQSGEINVIAAGQKSMDVVHFAVNGTLMRGLELNGNLHRVHATFVREAFTEPTYRLWSIGDRHPAMQRVIQGGTAIAVEVWAVPVKGMATILQLEPPGLCIGKVRLADGEEVLGVLGEAVLCEGQKEITAWGCWRAYMNSIRTQQPEVA